MHVLVGNQRFKSKLNRSADMWFSMHADRAGLRVHVPAAADAASGLHVVCRRGMHDMWDENKGTRCDGN
jgi:hypothetical protein